MKKTSQGFTLVELAIVLVIIGLITGGIVAGQSLISSAKINEQVSQLKGFEVAYNIFINKYDAVPGDMILASEYWSGAPNGDGDGWIDIDAISVYNLPNEGLGLFEHLSLAGLIPEMYDSSWVIGVGYPELKLVAGKGISAGGRIYVNGGATAANASQLPGADMIEEFTASLYLNVANPAVSDGNFDNLGVMNPEQMKKLDTKMDDGRARSGLFMAYSAYSGSANCLDGIGGDYDLTEEGIFCMGQFILQK